MTTPPDVPDLNPAGEEYTAEDVTKVARAFARHDFPVTSTRVREYAEADPASARFWEQVAAELDVMERRAAFRAV